MVDESIEIFRQRLKHTVNCDSTKQLAIGSHKNLHNWFSQITAFSSAAIIVSAGLLAKASTSVYLPFIYVSMILASWATLQSLWFIKKRVVEDVNKISTIYGLIKEGAKLGESKDDAKRLCEIKSQLEEEESKASLKSCSPSLVMWLVAFSVILMIAAILSPVVLKFYQEIMRMLDVVAP